MSPTAFITYSWDNGPHERWVGDLAKRLRRDGVDATYDKWETVPGDQLPDFMEQAIADNDFVLIVCTPRYKTRSEARTGGVGYEGHVMTAEVLNEGNHRKFIPIVRSGAWRDAVPSWLQGKYRIDLSGDTYSEEEYAGLVRAILGIREQPPPIGQPMSTIGQTSVGSRGTPTEEPPKVSEEIKLTGIVVESVTEPRNDGTYGSALYSIPISLSHAPDSEWCRLFIRNWDSPCRFTTMHRPGIASIRGATVVLSGTSIEEVERYHRDTLVLALEETNRQYRALKEEQERVRRREQAMRETHKTQVEDVAKRIRFD